MPEYYQVKKSNIRFQYIIVSTGILLLITKFIAYLLTNSNAILTDALESIVNVMAGAFTLYSLILSSKPKDENHPYGHGKIEFISASIEGALITLAGVGIIGKSIYNLFYPTEISQLDLGILLTVIAGAINFIIGHFAEVRGKKSDSVAMVSGGKHLKSDAYSTIGLIIGLAVIYITDIVWLDNVVAIIFGGVIIYTGYKILKKSIAGIMDEADEELLEKIIEVLKHNREPNWVDIHNMRVIKYGNHLHIDCHVTLPWYFNIKEAHYEIDKIDQLINANIKNSVEFFIHADHCLPTSCNLCTKQDCEVRKEPFKARWDWNLANVMRNKKHGLV